MTLDWRLNDNFLHICCRMRTTCEIPIAHNMMLTQKLGMWR